MLVVVAFGSLVEPVNHRNVAVSLRYREAVAGGWVNSDVVIWETRVLVAGVGRPGGGAAETWC